MLLVKNSLGIRRGALLAAAVLAVLVLAPSAFAQNNECDMPGEEPDVITGDIYSPTRYGTVGNITGYAIGTTSCNIGTCWAEWFSGDSGLHPVIAQNLYRFKDGRMEHIGQSWLKHSFATLDGSICEAQTGGTCIPAGGAHLGVNCSDPYGPGLNASQGSLGPKFEVDPWTGVHDHPYTAIGQTGNAIYKRLQVHHDDLNPSLNSGAVYYLEAQYVAVDDATAGNQYNNVSYRETEVDVSGGDYNLSLVGSTVRMKTALDAWSLQDPLVLLKSGSAFDDGIFNFASRAYDNGDGTWDYEYAIHNQTSTRAARAFEVPIPTGIILSSVGFHDVDYHSGEPQDGTDWAISLSGGNIVWSTDTFATNPNANALEWGTTYNFRFTANAPPVSASGTLQLFRPGAGTSIVSRIVAPDPSGGSTGAGSVENQLLATKDGGGNLTLSWGQSCIFSDTDYSVYEGTIGAWASHTSLQCSTGGSTQTTFAPAGGGLYYLVVPNASSVEGSYGLDSNGSERPQAVGACNSQTIANCP